MLNFICIFGCLPLVSFVFAVLCWLISLMVHLRILRTAVRDTVTMLLTPSMNRYAAAILFRAKCDSLRVAASRITVYFALISQAALAVLTVCCCLKFPFFSTSNEAALPFYITFGDSEVVFALADPFNVALVFLTEFIFLVSFAIVAREVQRNLSFWCGLLFVLEGFLLSAFITSNLLLFYISFEATLLPMYLLIGAWGSRPRKIKANYYFFLYTLVGSFATLIGLLLLYHYTGTFSYDILLSIVNSRGDHASLLPSDVEKLVWLLLSLGFLVKLPLFTVHLWLPEAHVEAPTVGSVILAALLLKLGLYGLVRVSLMLLPYGTVYWLPFLVPVLLLGSFYPAAVASVQDDLKKIVAYSSVSHMSLAVLGLLTLTVEGVSGAMFLSIGHGITSGGLFAFVGFLYDRYKTRDIKYFGGLASSMPLSSCMLLILVLGNVGFPFLCNFPGELLIMIGSFKRFNMLVLFLGLGFFLTSVYSFRLVNLLLFGSSKAVNIENRYDTTREEYAVLLAFAGATFLLGVFCSPLLGIFGRFALVILNPYASSLV